MDHSPHTVHAEETQRVAQHSIWKCVCCWINIAWCMKNYHRRWTAEMLDMSKPVLSTGFRYWRPWGSTSMLHTCRISCSTCILSIHLAWGKLIHACKMKWHGIDWCVELNNLFMKICQVGLTFKWASLKSWCQVKNHGKGPNQTVKWIILKSLLVQIYRNIQKKNYTSKFRPHLSHLQLCSTRYGQTFLKLQKRLHLISSHVIHMGRKSQHVGAVLSDKGIAMMEKVIQGEENEKDMSEENRVELEDILVEMLE